jgi:hypothetical protein
MALTVIPELPARRPWRELLLVILLLVLGDFGLRAVGRAFLFSPWAASGDRTIAEQLFWTAGRQPDVVFMGDSRMGNGLNPQLVEQELAGHGVAATVVNIWLAGAGPVDFREIVRNVLASHRPRLVICNINENALSVLASDDGTPEWERTLRDRYVDWLPDTSSMTWRSRQFSGALQWGALVKRAAYNAFYDVLRVTFQGRPWPYGSLGGQRGYLPRYGRQRAERLTAQADVDGRRYADAQVSAWAERQFREFLAAAQAAQLRLVVVALPVHPLLVARFPPDRYDSFVGFLARVTREYDVPFVNDYACNCVPEDGFFDPHHLNDVGATLVSRRVAQSMVLPALHDWPTFNASFRVAGSPVSPAARHTSVR